MQIGMTSKRAKDYIIVFKAFVGVILMKLDISEMTNSHAYQSLIFYFLHLLKVNFLLPSIRSFIMLYFFHANVWHLVIFFFKAFLNFIKANTYARDH